MAKLKIFENENPSQNIPSVEGYQNVAIQLIAQLPAFDGATDKQKSDLLQNYASSAGTHTIFQLTRGTGPGGSDQEVPINSTNCSVQLEYDGRKKPSVNLGKHNIVLPEMQQGETLNTSYLSEYVRKIVTIYGAQGGGSPTQMANACNFLFGVMLLTRCR